MTDGARGEHRYQAFFCEENVWHLCADPAIPDPIRAAVFISNAARAVAVAQQRIAPIPGFPVVWDYHVVMASRPADDAAWRVWDLDSTLPMGAALDLWLDESFGGAWGFGEQHAPRFRVIEALAFRSALQSDRSHMRDDDGTWIQPPPPWPTIGEAGGTNLMRFVDMDDDVAGTVTTREGLAAVLASTAAQSSGSSNAP